MKPIKTKGRPRGRNKINVKVSLPLGLYERLEYYAAQWGEYRSAVVEQALEKLLPLLPEDGR